MNSEDFQQAMNDLGDNLSSQWGPVIDEPPAEKRQTVADVAREVQSNGGVLYDWRKERRVRIILEENDYIPPTGQFIGLNGQGFLLRPGVEAEVPESLLGVLNDAIEEVPVRQGDQVVGYKQRLRFPYRIMRA